jgi:hypothetical protein
VPDLQLEIPFFMRTLTNRVIDEIGQAESLCLFTGAGVSVDRTGVTWERLMANLLVDASGRQLTFDQAFAVVETLGVFQAGSAVVQRHYEEAGQEQWQKKVCDLLRPDLYRHRDWLGGQVTGAIAQLWGVLADKDIPMSIVTTNYDEHIWLELDALYKTVTTKVPIGRAPDVDPVIYLHGKIPERGDIPLVDGRPQYPVLSERDYVEHADEVRESLASEFRSKNVLMVGSSLRDRPLIDALIITRSQEAAADLKRWALVPRGDLKAVGTGESDRRVVENHHARLKHLGVEGIYFDYYSQVAQFLTEINIARGVRRPAEYKDSASRHTRRLADWWTTWFKQIDASDKAKKLQNRHHGELLAARNSLTGALGAVDEEIKIELWLRWDPGPGPTNRELRLWASSFSKFSRWTAARTASIIDDGHLLAVQAFRSGKVEYAALLDNPDPARNTEGSAEEKTPRGVHQESQRWKTLMAVPIRTSLSGRPNVIVGVVLLASMDSESNSGLSEKKRGLHETKLAKLRELVEGMVSTVR